MSNLEHYFENLLHHGSDIKGNPNKNALTEEEIKAVETCAWYVIYTLFDGRESLDNFLKEQMEEDIEVNELKPCPFCGGEATLMTRQGKSGWRDRFYVLCDFEDGGCGAESGWYHYDFEAIEAWNRRERE